MDSSYSSDELLYGNQFIDPVDIQDMTYDEQQNFIKNLEKQILPKNKNPPKKIQRFQKNIVIIDSFNRNKSLYPNQNSFVYDFEKGFDNVQSIKLVMSVFPNTDNVIKNVPENQRNNRIYWSIKNEQQVNVQDPPIYSIEITPGSYTAADLIIEIRDKMNTQKLYNVISDPEDEYDFILEETGFYQYFEVEINEDTDISTFKCIKRNQITTIDPITVTQNSYIVTVSETNHQLEDGTPVYFYNIPDLGGIDSSFLNGVFNITFVDANTYTFLIKQKAFFTQSGGSTNVIRGIENPFKFLWQEFTDTPISVLGFLEQNSSVSVNNINPFRPLLFNGISGYITNNVLTLVVESIEGLSPLSTLQRATISGISGDTPTVDIEIKEAYTIENINYIDFFYTSASIVITGPIKIYTNLCECSFPGHNFSPIESLEIVTGGFNITTLFNHNLTQGDIITLFEFPNESTNGVYLPIIIDETSFFIKTRLFPGVQFLSGFLGYIGSSSVRFYNINNINGTLGGLDIINLIEGRDHRVTSVIDENRFVFAVPQIFTSTEQSGGSIVEITDEIHGFSGIQNNQKSDQTLSRTINLKGSNYVYICSPEISSTVRNNTGVNDVFSIIKLSEDTGNVIFNSFQTNPKVFYESPLRSLNRISFNVKNSDGSFYNFNNVDYTIGLEIVEIIDVLENTNISSSNNIQYNNNELDYLRNIIN